MQARKLRLRFADGHDRRWLAATIDRASGPFGTRVELAPDGVLALRGYGQ
jgi:hypothetical protein